MNAIARRAELACQLAELRRLADRLTPIFAQRDRPYLSAYSRWRRRPPHQGTVVSGTSALRSTGE